MYVMKRVIKNGFETNMCTKNFVFLNFVFLFCFSYLFFLKTDCFKRKQQQYEHGVEIFVY